MSKDALLLLIKEAVKNELTSLEEASKVDKLVRPGKDRPWKAGDAVTIKQLEKVFNWFHLSNQHLGSGDYFRFTPRVPRDPWEPLEDDFTKRISLAPSISKAVQAVGNTMRDYVYAADIKGYEGDNIDTIELADTFPNCPSSPGNKYGKKFNVNRWIKWLDKTNQLSEKDRKKLNWILNDPYSSVEEDSDTLSPKKLPPDLKQQFTACVPDANDTKEAWTTEPEVFIRVAYVDNHPSISFYDYDEDQLAADSSPDDLYLTEAGAKVFNAVHADASEITYSR